MRIYPAELQLNKVNSSETEAPFFFFFFFFFFLLFFNLSISNAAVSTKIYDKRNDFDFDSLELLSRSSMGMSLGVRRIDCTYLSLFVSLEHLLT